MQRLDNDALLHRAPSQPEQHRPCHSAVQPCKQEAWSRLTSHDGRARCHQACPMISQVKSIMQRHLGRAFPPATKRAAHRLLTEAHAYLLQRLGALSQACVVCDEPLEMPGAKPVPCRHAPLKVQCHSACNHVHAAYHAFA